MAADTLRQRPPRHVQLQRLDSLHAGAHARRRLSHGARRSRARRLLFGTDSSFFPRGWNKEIVDRQQQALADAGIDDAARAKIMGAELRRLFPL